LGNAAAIATTAEEQRSSHFSKTLAEFFQNANYSCIKQNGIESTVIYFICFVSDVILYFIKKFDVKIGEREREIERKKERGRERELKGEREVGKCHFFIRYCFNRIMKNTEVTK
jgi:hypothetical protein